MLVANRCHRTNLAQKSEHVGSNIRTIWLVAQILRQLFFKAFRSREARLDRYLRNTEIS